MVKHGSSGRSTRWEREGGEGMFLWLTAGRGPGLRGNLDIGAITLPGQSGV